MDGAEEGLNRKVGYGNPPKHSQFKRGKSGNPRGRRRGEQNLLTIFKEIVSEKIKVRLGGRLQTMTMGEAVLRANYAKALKKDQKAMHNLFAMAEEARLFVDLDDPTQTGGILAVPEPCSTIEQFVAEHGGPCATYGKEK